MHVVHRYEIARQPLPTPCGAGMRIPPDAKDSLLCMQELPLQRPKTTNNLTTLTQQSYAEHQ